MRLKYIKLILFSLIPWLAPAQTFPASVNGIEAYIRREQLWGNYSPISSFIIRPLAWSSFDSLYYTPRLLKNKLEIAVLPVDVSSSYNTHHPYPMNDGPMIPARFQTFISAGVRWNNEWVSIQVKPELVFSPVTKYPGFPEENAPLLWANRYVWWNRMDTPERFGHGSYLKMFPGQSSVRLNHKKLSFGISSENLWWGPGKWNSITMSNNAPGFLHVTLNTMSPIKSKIGSFEGQLIGGRLISSGFTPPSPEIKATQTELYVPKFENWRYLSGLSLTYQPSPIKGLFVGYSNLVQQYASTVKPLDVFSGITSVFTYDEGPGDHVPKYQISAVFLRWLLSEEKAEVYFEYGIQNPRKHRKNTHSMLQPTAGYIFGLSKIFALSRKDQGIQIEFEMTRMQQRPEHVVNTANSFYADARIRQGYTHQGQYLGAAIGSGSNHQVIAVSWLNGSTKIGLELQHLDQHNDFYYFHFEHNRDYRTYWDDYVVGFSGFSKLGKFTFNGNIRYVRSLNYQWELEYDPSLPFFRPGNDINNIQMYIGLGYWFGK